MHGDDGQIWESFGGHCVAKPIMDSPKTGKWFLRFRAFHRQNSENFKKFPLVWGGVVVCVLSICEETEMDSQSDTLPVASSPHSSWLSKDDGKASDGPTSLAVLEQVPNTDLGWILTDFLNERRRRKLLGGSGGMLPRYIFWILTPHSFLSWVFFFLESFS